MAERSADWIAQARHDLALARYALAGGYFDWASFAAQQAAEKAIKAVFKRTGAEVWGHSIDQLLAELAESHAVPVDAIQGGRELDKAYIPARDPDAYPAGSPSRVYTRAEAERLVEHGAFIVGFCESLLPGPQP